MDEAGRLVARLAAARIHPPRLEIATHRAGRNLATGLLARQPDLDVIGLLCTETHIAGAQHHGPEMQTELFEHVSALASSARAPQARFQASVIDTSSTFENWCWRSIAAGITAGRTGLGAETCVCAA
jgi:hypothetical protein